MPRSGIPFRSVKDCRVGRKRPPRNDKFCRFFWKTGQFLERKGFNNGRISLRSPAVPRSGMPSRSVKDCRVGRKRPPRNDKSGRFCWKTKRFQNETFDKNDAGQHRTERPHKTKSIRFSNKGVPISLRNSTAQKNARIKQKRLFPKQKRFKFVSLRGAQRRGNLKAEGMASRGEAREHETTKSPNFESSRRDTTSALPRKRHFTRAQARISHAKHLSHDHRSYFTAKPYSLARRATFTAQPFRRARPLSPSVSLKSARFPSFCSKSTKIRPEIYSKKPPLPS